VAIVAAGLAVAATRGFIDLRRAHRADSQVLAAARMPAVLLAVGLVADVLGLEVLPECVGGGSYGWTVALLACAMCAAVAAFVAGIVVAVRSRPVRSRVVVGIAGSSLALALAAWVGCSALIALLHCYSD
jgi:hypothetical protein